MTKFTWPFHSGSNYTVDHSRRNALRKITLSAGALSLTALPDDLFASGNPAQSPKKLGIALVGLGNYSTQQLAPALQETKFCKLDVCKHVLKPAPPGRKLVSNPVTTLEPKENYGFITYAIT